jgi:uncharacterized membrane protein
VAGIGFRLKRLIAEESYAGWLRAHLYGAVVSSGPWLLSVTTLAGLALLAGTAAGTADQNLFRAIVAYTYTLSLVTTGAAQMVVTRHLADCLYTGDAGAFLRAYRWTLGGTALGHGVLAAIFYGLAPDLPLVIRVFGGGLFVVVACTWMTMIFVGAAQDYATVLAAFFVGNAGSLAAALLLGAWGGSGGYVAGFVLGQAVVLFVLHGRVERDFGTGAVPGSSGLVAAFRRYPVLALAGFAYNAAIAADRMLFWFSGVGAPVQSWFYGSLYDAPLFLAYLSVVPALAMFLVNVETGFYDRYRQYYGVVTKHGTLRQVLEAKAQMAASLRESLRRLLVVQAPVTLGLMIVAPALAAAIGLEPLQVSIFRIALVGAALHTLALFGTIVLLYFDRRRAALEVSACFLVGNVLLTAASLAVGPRAWGLGYALATLLACAWAYRRLEQTLDDLEYLTYASQPMAAQ